MTGERMDTGTERDWSLLMRAANRGDQVAYRHLLGSVAPALRRFARARVARVGLAPADVEDVVQETLIAIHLKRGTWRDGEPLEPWIFAIAGHKLIDAARRTGRHRAVDIAESGEIIPAAPDPDPTEASDRDRILGRLDRRSAAIVRAVGLEGVSVAEAAMRFGISEGAIRVAVHRGLRKLSAMRERLIG